MGSLDVTSLTAFGWQAGQVGYSEEDLLVMERMRKFSSAMLKQAAVDLLLSDVDEAELQSLRKAAEGGDKAAEGRHDELQERRLIKRTAKTWLERWNDTQFDIPFEWCALAVWPSWEPENVARVILTDPMEYLSCARQQDIEIGGPRPRSPRPC